MKYLNGAAHVIRVEDGAFSLKIDHIKKKLGDSKSLPNYITGSKVTAFLLKVWILPVGGTSSVDGLQSTRLRCLVFICVSL